jgi:hypothetical protein
MESSPNKATILGLLAVLILLCFLPSMLRTKGPPREDVSSVQVMAQNGDPFSQLKLGLMYEKGRGVKKDLIESYKWLTLAGRTGLGVGRDRKRIGQKLTKAQIAEALNRANAFVASGPVPDTTQDDIDMGVINPNEPQPKASVPSTNKRNSSASSSANIK